MTKRKHIALFISAVLLIVSFACGIFLVRASVTASAAAITLSVNQAGARVAYGPGWGDEAAQEVSKAFNDKISELNITEHGSVEVYNAAADGDAVVFGMQCTYNSQNSYLMYNVFNKEVYLVTDSFADKKGEVRRIGAPVSNQLTGIKVTGWDGEGNQVNVTGTTVQVFETGICIIENGSAVKHEGVVEKISGTEYKIHPIIRDQDILRDNYTFIGDVDGTWHALRTARTSREDGKLAVEFNFRAGCIKVVYNDNYSLDSRMAYAGQNFAYDTNGTQKGRVALPKENFTTDEHLWENNEDGVDSAALTMFRNLSGNANASKNAVKDAFRAGYMELLDAGIIPGYRCSWIKVWDVLCVDYKYSPDSMYGFDGVGSAARERMFTLVYSGVQNKVYGVGDDFWNVWREDSVRRALGAPISNALTNVTISGNLFKRIQIFEQGYIYENEKGALTVEYGTTTDNEYKNFSFKAAPPEKPEKYGTELARFEATEDGHKIVYINYEKGAVKATEMHTKMGYLYDYFPGRNFEENGDTYTAKMLSYEKLYNNDDFTCKVPAYSNIFDKYWTDDEGNLVASVKSQMIETIQALLGKGFFPGFLEGTFEAWNGVTCQQFIYGDSTAQPWGGDARTNVCAMVYNDEKNQIFLLKDAFMEYWGGSKQGYLTLGAPAGEEFTIGGNDNVKFQYFYGTATQNNLAFAISVGYNEATSYAPSTSAASRVNPAQYLKDFEELSKPLSGIKIEEPESTTVAVGDYEEIEYVIDGAAADATITITSSNESIAAVMEDGSVEFYKTGKVTITVTVSDGVNTFSDSVTFNVVKGGKAAAAAGTLSAGNGGNGVLIGSICGVGALLALGAAVFTIRFRKIKVR